MANFLASSYWNVSIRRYEKRQREIIMEDGLCWPEKSSHSAGVEGSGQEHGWKQVLGGHISF